MEIAIAGQGEVIIRFIDSKGRTLVQEKLVVSGSTTVEARRIMTLSVETTRGATLLAPVLLWQSNPEQRVTFDREAPSHFSRRRCAEIGCSPDITAEAERGCAASLAPAEVLLSGDQALARLIETVVQGDQEHSK